MKLHLPLSLRAALLGCFAAAALVSPAAAADLTWDPANSTWAVGEPFASDDTTFQQNDNVTFGPLTTKDETVNLAEQVFFCKISVIGAKHACESG